VSSASKPIASVIFSIFAFFAGVHLAFGATVKSARGTKVLLALDIDETREPGEILLVSDRAHDHEAKLLVISVTGRQMIAELQSGDVEIGDKAMATGEKVKSKKIRVVEEPVPPPPPPPKPRPKPEPPPKPALDPKVKAARALLPVWSVFGGISEQFQTVKLTNAAQVALSGVSFFARGSYYSRMPGYHLFTWEAGAGVDQVSTTGSLSTGACNGVDSTVTSCSYQSIALTPFGRVGYLLPLFEEEQLQVRLGTDLLFPITSQSNVVDQAAFNPLLYVTAGAALHLDFDSGLIIPIGFDVSYYIGNSAVSMTRFMFYAGYSWH
jgi:hypothetical protein